MLGTLLAARLRAQYINGKFETPSFMVALEAPQGQVVKSFMKDVSQMVSDSHQEKDDQGTSQRSKGISLMSKREKDENAGTPTKG